MEDGTQAEGLRLSTGGLRTTQADGTVTTADLLGDPRFGVQASYGATQTLVTGGKTRTDTLGQTVAGFDPLNPLQFTALTETHATNGGPAETGVYTQSTRTSVGTSRVGRTSSAVF